MRKIVYSFYLITLFLLLVILNGCDLGSTKIIPLFEEVPPELPELPELPKETPKEYFMEYSIDSLILKVDEDFQAKAPRFVRLKGEKFRVAPDLPEGLILDEETGTLSGTPTKSNDPQFYTISYGEFKFKILISVRKRIAKKISVGVFHSCALFDDSTVACWGNNSYGQLVGELDAFSTPNVRDIDLQDVEDISSGYQHICALLSDKTVYCWGDDEYGQLGGNFVRTGLPQKVDVENIIQISSGAFHTCSLDSDGKVFCWGGNNVGQIDLSIDQRFVPEPIELTFPTQVSKIRCGDASTCIIDVNGDAYCWGENSIGQLGHGKVSPSPVPSSIVVGEYEVDDISQSLQHSCLLTDGEVKCFGSNVTGELGLDFSIASTSFPDKSVDLHSVTKVSTGMFYTCAISDHDLYCWGTNDLGQLGSPGAGFLTSEPSKVSFNDSPIEDFDMAVFHTCAISMGAVKCWGMNTTLQLGNAELIGTPFFDRPVLVEDI
jgi:alpha-tubulin suppressor-like RCC1 family protein